MKCLKMLVATGAVAVALLVPAASAQGACATANHPSDGSWVTVCDLHNVAVCDGDPDGHKTYARLWSWYSPDYYLSGYDTYGRDADGQFCHHEGVWGWGIFQFAVCVQYEGCSGWKRT